MTILFLSALLQCHRLLFPLMIPSEAGLMATVPTPLVSPTSGKGLHKQLLALLSKPFFFNQSLPLRPVTELAKCRMSWKGPWRSGCLLHIQNAAPPPLLLGLFLLNSLNPSRTSFQAFVPITENWWDEIMPVYVFVKYIGGPFYHKVTLGISQS